MTKKAVLYRDEGVSDFTLMAAHDGLIKAGYEADFVDSAAILNRDGRFTEAQLLVMPGGADEPYHARLGHQGASIIRRFVEDGGAYLGLCAGAYYACASFEFNKGLPTEIIRNRPLGFFDGKAVGSIVDFAPPYDQTLNTAAIVHVKWSDSEAQLYYHGGPVFLTNNKENPQPKSALAFYDTLDEGQNAALIFEKIGQGRVVLCSAHPEVTALHFRKRLEQETYPQAFSHLLKSLESLDTEREIFWNKMLALL